MRRIVGWFLNMELRRMIKWVVTLLLIVFVATQSVFLWAMGGSVRSSRLEMLSNLAAQLQSHTDTVLTTINSNANNVAYGIISSKFATAQTMVNSISAYNQLGTLLDALVVANPNIEHIFYTDFDMILIGYISEDVLALRKRVAGTFEREGWPTTQRNFTMKIDGRNHLLCVTPSHMRNGKRLYAVISYVLDVSTLSPFGEANGAGHMLLLDGAGSVVYANTPVNKRNIDHLLEEGQLDRDGLISWSKNGYFVAASRESASTGWRWICSISSGVVMDELSSVIQFTVLTDIVVLVMMALFVVMFESGISRPLSSIVRFVDTAEEQVDKRRLAITTSNEIGQIAGLINRLLDSAERTNRERQNAQRRVFELEIVQKQTELNALYSQINPHFLYNTLDCLRSIALVREVPEIVDIATYMSDIFRYSIKGRNFVRLDEELECIDEYIGIMQIRFRNRFCVTVDVDEALRAMYIPRMILQPIVENAIFHGLEQSRREAMLRISGHQDQNGGMWLEVWDNGRGMSEEALRSLRRMIDDRHGALNSIVDERRSIGLANIVHRVRLLFGEGYGLHVNSTPEDGTMVRLHLPVTTNMLDARRTDGE